MSETEDMPVQQWLSALKDLSQNGHAKTMETLGRKLLSQDGMMLENDLQQRKTIVAMKKVVKYRQTQKLYKLLAIKLKLDPRTIQNQTTGKSMKAFELRVQLAKKELADLIGESNDNNEDESDKNADEDVDKDDDKKEAENDDEDVPMEDVNLSLFLEDDTEEKLREKVKELTKELKEANFFRELQKKRADDLYEGAYDENGECLVDEWKEKAEELEKENKKLKAEVGKLRKKLKTFDEMKQRLESAEFLTAKWKRDRDHYSKKSRDLEDELDQLQWHLKQRNADGPTPSFEFKPRRRQSEKRSRSRSEKSSRPAKRARRRSPSKSQS